MSSIQQQIEAMDPEAIYDLAEELAQKYSLDTDKSYTAEEITDLFKLLHASQTVGDLEGSSDVFSALQIIIHRFYDEQEDKREALDFLIDWSILAIRFTQEKATEFACMHVYEDLFDVFEEAPAELQYKKGRVILQMAHHYAFWQGNGGIPDDLPAEQLAQLNAVTENCVETAEACIASAEEQENWTEASKATRSLYRYYLAIRKPNEAIATMKDLIDLLPKTPDYHAADTADAYMTLGQVFLQFNKYGPAKKYFGIARDLFAEGGEELEMFVYQAEGWIEECEKHL